MFAKYLKQLNRVAFYRPPTRNISFLKNLMKKEEPAPQTTPETPQEKPLENQEIPNPQVDQRLEQEIEGFRQYQAFEQGLTSQPTESSYESELPEPPKSRSTELQEEIDKELDLPYKLYGSQVIVEPKVFLLLK